jgi:hypothetical protein
LSKSNSLAKTHGKLGFLVKLQKIGSNKLVKALSILGSLENIPLPGANMRALERLASGEFGTSPVL